MGYEVDFLAVGDKKSGDALAMRVWDGVSSIVIVLDGGYAEDGAKLAQHIKSFYNTTHVDLVISTHPDGDHSAGLKALLKLCSVGQLWMHLPWQHTSDISKYFAHGRVTDASVRRELKRSLEDAYDLESLAKEKGIPIFEPFAGHISNGPGVTLRVLGPSLAYYESLLPHFRGTPEPTEDALTLQRFFQAAGGALAETFTRIAEEWGIETLTDDGKTSAENNSSVIVLLTCGAKHLLFTADAGIPALAAAADELDRLGIAREDIGFVQVPHHGSRRNVGPTVLDRLLGPRLQHEAVIRTGFVSAAINGKPKHPSKCVLNAFRRRGTPVHGTEGVPKWHYSPDAPSRANYGPSTPHPLYTEFEE